MCPHPIFSSAAPVQAPTLPEKESQAALERRLHGKPGLAGHADSTRLLLMAPTMLFLLVGFGIDPGWSRFLAAFGLVLVGVLTVVSWYGAPTFGLVLVGVLTVVSWYGAPRAQRVLFKTLYFGGFLAYVASLLA